MTVDAREIDWNIESVERGRRPRTKPTCDGIKRINRRVQSGHQVRRGHDNSATHTPRKATVLHEDSRGQSLRTQQETEEHVFSEDWT